MGEEVLELIETDFDNLEIGCGCHSFGTIFYPTCLQSELKKGFSEICPEANHIHYYFDAMTRIPFTDNSFSKIILANPFGYGFKNRNLTSKLLPEIVRVLKPNAEVILLYNESNKYCNSYRVSTYFPEVLNNMSVRFSIDVIPIDSSIEYPNFIFRQIAGQQTYPTQKATIYVSK